jgi:hypothetical protein
MRRHVSNMPRFPIIVRHSCDLQILFSVLVAEDDIEPEDLSLLEKLLPTLQTTAMCFVFNDKAITIAILK